MILADGIQLPDSFCAGFSQKFDPVANRHWIAKAASTKEDRHRGHWVLLCLFGLVAIVFIQMLDNLSSLNDHVENGGYRFDMTDANKWAERLDCLMLSLDTSEKVDSELRHVVAGITVFDQAFQQGFRCPIHRRYQASQHLSVLRRDCLSGSILLLYGSQESQNWTDNGNRNRSPNANPFGAEQLAKANKTAGVLHRCSWLWVEDLWSEFETLPVGAS